MTKWAGALQEAVNPEKTGRSEADSAAHNETRDPITSVNIRPGVSVLSVLRHLKYKAWFALAEFVDNSLQSYLSNRAELEAIHGKDFQLEVRIDFESGPPAQLSVKDNAAGIAQRDFPRAFRPAAIPANSSGLSEFGMGMKSAACWFAPFWRVRTTALNEAVERTIVFDIERIVHDQIEELAISEEYAWARTNHYTEVVMEGLHQNLVGRTLGKVKEHLTDIFRVFLQDGTLKLHLNNEELKYLPPPILSAPLYKDKTGSVLEWRKNISFDFGDNLKISGYAALMDPAQTSRSGFSLFRRNRLIEGSGDEGYRPYKIFGQAGNFRWRRLFGELHLEGFDVSHTKDGFKWDENEEPFLDLLLEHLDSEELPLLKQADRYRVKEAHAGLTATAEQAANNVSESMKEHLPKAMPSVADAGISETSSEALASVVSIAKREIEFKFKEEDWRVVIELANDASESRWLTVSDQPAVQNGTRKLEIRLNLAHKFMINFTQANVDQLEPILRIAAALAVSEVLARQAGVKGAGTIRRNINELLTEVMANLAD